MSNFGYTNKTESTKSIGLQKLGLKSNYSKTEEATQVIYDNKTCPLDLGEKIVMSSKVIKNVDNTLTNNHPSNISGGVQYRVQTEALFREYLTADNSTYVDHPIVVYTTIRHERCGAVTEQVVEEALMRSISSLFKDDGSSRVPDLMRLAVEVEEN